MTRLIGGSGIGAGERVRAVWHGAVLAESDRTEIVEGNHYFPANSIDRTLVRPSPRQSVCPWKGTASYLDVVVGGEVNQGAAWFYPQPKAAAASIKDRVAFWQGVKIEAVAADEATRG